MYNYTYEKERGIMGLTDSTLKKINEAKQAVKDKTADKEQEVAEVCSAAEQLVAHTVVHRVLAEKARDLTNPIAKALCTPFKLGVLANRWGLMTALAGAIDRLLEHKAEVASVEEEVPSYDCEAETSETVVQEVPAEPTKEEPAVEAFAEVAVADVALDEDDGDDDEEDDDLDGIDVSNLEFIDVMEQPEDYQAMLEREAAGEVRLVNRYRRSFRSRLIQSRGNVQEYYSILKNALLSYKGVKERTSWDYESFNKGRAKVAKINAKTKTLYLYLAIDPAELQDTKYFFDDMSSKKKYAAVPVLLKIKGERKLKHALELIEKICGEQMELPPVKDFEAHDYTVPFEDTAALVQNGLIKQYTAAVHVSVASEEIPLF